MCPFHCYKPAQFLITTNNLMTAFAYAYDDVNNNSEPENSRSSYFTQKRRTSCIFQRFCYVCRIQFPAGRSPRCFYATLFTFFVCIQQTVVLICVSVSVSMTTASGERMNEVVYLSRNFSRSLILPHIKLSSAS